MVSCRTVLTLLLALLLTGGVQGRTFDDIVASGFIRIGVYRDFPPYSYEENGVARGVDVEVGRAIADQLGVQLQLHWMLADENLDDDLRNHVWKGHYLGGGVADVMLRVPYDRDFAYMTDPDGLVINDLVHLFGPYQKERWALAYDSQQLDPFANLAVFQYQRIGVEIDSLPDFYLSSAFGGRLRNNVMHYSTLAQAAAAMQAGELPALMGMRAQVEWSLVDGEAQGSGTQARSERFPVPRIPFTGMTRQAWDIGMAVKDAHRQLGYAVTDVIDRLVSSGRLEAIFRAYGLTYELPDMYRRTAG